MIIWRYRHLIIVGKGKPHDGLKIYFRLIKDTVEKVWEVKYEQSRTDSEFDSKNFSTVTKCIKIIQPSEQSW